ncbi:unnamed protein product [Cutaneotrichosporon oleaginosum]
MDASNAGVATLHLGTSLSTGRGGMPLLFDAFNLYRTSTALEQNYRQDTAAYAWSLTVVAALILVTCVTNNTDSKALNQVPVFKFPILFRAFLTALVYMWARENPTAKVNIFGLISIPTRLYPFVLIALDLIQRGPAGALLSIMGIVTGHFW